MKTLHLICTAHLDPVWQWDWDEGASAALATFYSAVNLAKDYDYIFCHNEVLLYEYIEKYDPKLFKEIQNLVAIGKWKIMGGWYVQPDCMVPSGESFIRQISLGREYFIEKFNSRPTVANNFDAFAHTRGLASILYHTGYDSYIVCRPMPEHDHFAKEKLPNGPFIWQGYDGSKIKVLRQEDITIYNSSLGRVKADIDRKVGRYPNESSVCVLWGVGNHGGGASRQDLDDILTLKEEKKNEWNIIHSSLEDYFKSVNPTTVVKRQFITFFKSYSSYNAIKLAHDQLENALYQTEKVCTIASLANLYHYDKSILKNAERVLCQIEFHDVLSGTAIKIGTDSSIRKAHHAIEELKGELFAAFNSIVSHLPKVKPLDDNFVIFNHYPYPYDGLIECEFLALEGIDPRNKYLKLDVYDLNHNPIPFQIIKEDSNIDIDRRKRLLMKVNIPACSAISIGVHYEAKEKINETNNQATDSDDIVISDNNKKITISRKTGLLTSFVYQNKEYLASPSMVPTIFNDNEDPWGWHLTRFDEKYDIMHKPHEHSNAFKDIKLDTKLKGIFTNLKSVDILNNGPLMSEVQSLFTYQHSHVVINYRIYHDLPYVDVNVHVLWNEKNKGLKMKLALNGERKYFAQAAYGQEIYKADKFEQPMNRYVGVNNLDTSFLIYNKSGIHSVSKNGKNLYLTLLNGAVACAHPTDHLPIVPDQKRFTPNIEHGVHDFSLRLMVNKKDECERFAKEFNEPLYALSYFPHGDGNVISNIITLSNKNIVITALKRLNDGGYLIRLYNGSDHKDETLISVNNITQKVNFKKFEFITLVFKNTTFKISKDASIY